MINFKALALTTIIAFGGIAGGNAAQACEGGGNWCSGNNVNPAPAPAAAPTSTYTFNPFSFGFGATDVYSTGAECLSTQEYISTNSNGTVNCY